MIWTLIPPFPASPLLLDEPLSSLTRRFGPPNVIGPTSAVPWHPSRSLAWEKSRGIGIWILQADWGKALPTATTHPDSVSRTLRVLGANLPFSGDAAVRATVLVPATTADPAGSAKGEVPLSLRQRADCMYQALKALPGVNQPVLRYKNGDGWNHPVLGYLSAWSDGMYQITFEAKRPMAGHDRYWFLAAFSGPLPPGLHIALLKSVMKNWKAKCNAEVEYEIN